MQKLNTLSPVLFALPVFMAVLFLCIKGTYLLGILAFYLLPGVYISIKERRLSARVALFSLIISIPFTIIVDYIGTVSGLWIVPFSAFPRFLGVIPLEDYIWLASAVFSIITVSGIDSKITGANLSLRKRAVTGIMSASLALFFVLYGIFGRNLFVFDGPYLYIILATLFFGMPTLALGIYFRKTFGSCFPAILHFLMLTFVFEATAITHSWWEFRGSYILKPLFVSGMALPFEELFFVGLIGPCMAILLYRFVFSER